MNSGKDSQHTNGSSEETPVKIRRPYRGLQWTLPFNSTPLLRLAVHFTLPWGCVPVLNERVWRVARAAVAQQPMRWLPRRYIFASSRALFAVGRGQRLVGVDPSGVLSTPWRITGWLCTALSVQSIYIQYIWGCFLAYCRRLSARCVGACWRTMSTMHDAYIDRYFSFYRLESFDHSSIFCIIQYPIEEHLRNMDISKAVAFVFYGETRSSAATVDLQMTFQIDVPSIDYRFFTIHREVYL